MELFIIVLIVFNSISIWGLSRTLKIHSLQIDILRIKLGLPTYLSKEQVLAEAEKLIK